MKKKPHRTKKQQLADDVLAVVRSRPALRAAVAEAMREEIRRTQDAIVKARRILGLPP